MELLDGTFTSLVRQPANHTCLVWEMSPATQFLREPWTQALLCEELLLAPDFQEVCWKPWYNTGSQ